jgi:chemotaxis protein methyltransferase CheR
MTLIKVKPEELKILATYVYEISGIVIDSTKGYLVESRLGPLVAEWKCSDYFTLCKQARADATGIMRNRIIDAISTNETSFFRDIAPFELLKHKLLPDHIDWLKGNPGNLQIWSAACSTGQEIYSIAIALLETLPTIKQWRIRLFGTDISDAAIAQASAGRYNEIEMGRGLHENKRLKYFEKRDNMWRVKDEIRAMASFRKFNLHDSLAGLGKFDIIFCRNVAIYFNPDTRKKLFERLADQLNPHGVLLIGSTESLLGVTDRFERKEHMRSVYYKLSEKAQ